MINIVLGLLHRSLIIKHDCLELPTCKLCLKCPHRFLQLLACLLNVLGRLKDAINESVSRVSDHFSLLFTDS